MLICFQKSFLIEEAIYELSKIVGMENKISRDNLTYKKGNKKKDKTVRSFVREIYNNDLSLGDVLECTNS